MLVVPACFSSVVFAQARVLSGTAYEAAVLMSAHSRTPCSLVAYRAFAVWTHLRCCALAAGRPNLVCILQVAARRKKKNTFVSPFTSCHIVRIWRSAALGSARAGLGGD